MRSCAHRAPSALCGDGVMSAASSSFDVGAASVGSSATRRNRGRDRRGDDPQVEPPARFLATESADHAVLEYPQQLGPRARRQLRLRPPRPGRRCDRGGPPGAPCGSARRPGRRLVRALEPPTRTTARPRARRQLTGTKTASPARWGLLPHLVGRLTSPSASATRIAREVTAAESRRGQSPVSSADGSRHPLVPHPVSWTHVCATRLDVACTPRALRAACDTPASRGASTGCSVRRTRRRPRAPRRGFERPGRRRLAP